MNATKGSDFLNQRGGPQLVNSYGRNSLVYTKEPVNLTGMYLRELAKQMQPAHSVHFAGNRCPATK